MLKLAMTIPLEVSSIREGAELACSDFTLTRFGSESAWRGSLGRREGHFLFNHFHLLLP